MRSEEVSLSVLRIPCQEHTWNVGHASYLSHALPAAVCIDCVCLLDVAGHELDCLDFGRGHCNGLGPRSISSLDEDGCCELHLLPLFHLVDKVEDLCARRRRFPFGSAEPRRCRCHRTFVSSLVRDRRTITVFTASAVMITAVTPERRTTHIREPVQRAYTNPTKVGTGYVG